LVCDVLAVSHPASLKRRPEDFRDFVKAMGMGKRWLSGTYQQIPEPEVVIVNRDNLPEVLEKMRELVRLSSI